jgi:hypothetical protein
MGVTELKERIADAERRLRAINWQADPSYLTCAHEGSHIWTAWRLGADPYRASIYASGDGLAFAHYNTVGDAANARILMAGGIAECIATTQPVENWHAIGGCGGDLQKLIPLVGNLQTPVYFEALRDTTQIVRAGWAKIMAIARELVIHRTLDRTQLEKLL